MYKPRVIKKGLSFVQLDNSVGFRDPMKVKILLYSLKGFENFCTRYYISQSSVLKAADQMKIRKVNKGEILFNEGDDCDMFYGIIKGRIGLKTIEKKSVDESAVTNNNSIHSNYNHNHQKHDFSHHHTYHNTLESNSSYQPKEIFKLYLEEGTCFGESALVTGGKRNATAYADADTYLFTIDKVFFDNHLKVSISFTFD